MAYHLLSTIILNEEHRLLLRHASQLVKEYYLLRMETTRNCSLV